LIDFFFCRSGKREAAGRERERVGVGKGGGERVMYGGENWSVGEGEREKESERVREGCVWVFWC